MLIVRRIFVLFAFVPILCAAGTRQLFDDWIVDITDQSVEAYTVSGKDTSLGVFCAGGQCVSYVRQSVSCTAGVRSTMMLNTGEQSIALTTLCLHVAQHSFQTIDQSNFLFETMKTAKTLAFATPIKDGGFAVSMFQMRGSQEAIKFALQEAVRMTKSQTYAPKSFAVPGVQKPDEIRL